MRGVIEVVPAQSRTWTLQVQSGSFYAMAVNKHEFLFTPDLVGIVTSISPSQGPAGTIVTVQGMGFSLNNSENLVLLGSFYACPIQSVSSTQILCQIGWNSSLSASKIEDVHVKKINIGFHRNVELIRYRFQAQINQIYPTEGSIAGGTEITIVGDGFIPEETRLIVGSIDYTSLAIITYTQIRFITEASPSAYMDQSIPITILIGLYPAVCTIHACTFIWSSRVTPSLTSLVPHTITDAQLLTLTGEHLDSSRSNISIGNQICTIIFASNTTIQCQISHLSAGNYSIMGSVEGKTSCE